MKINQNNTKKDITRTRRWIYKLIAVVCLAMTIVGIIVPGLPASEFLILAAWAAAKGSPTIYRKIMSVRYFRSMIENWQNGGIISRSNKIYSAISMSCGLVILIVTGMPATVVIAAATGMGIGSIFIWRRPESPRADA